MSSGISLIEASRWQGVELSLMRTLIQNAPLGAINLALGELGYAMPDNLREYAKHLMQSSTAVYTPNAGMPELREAIAAYYAQGVLPEQVCATNGAQEALFLSLFSFLEHGDRVAVPDPDYTAYHSLLKVLGAQVIRLPYGKDLKSIDWDLWEQLLTYETKAIVLSSPNNPSGFYLRQADVRHLSEICNNRGIWVVLDEIYRELCFGPEPASMIGECERLFVISGLSKSHCLSGWRLGWTVAPKPLSATLIKAKQYVSTCSGWLAQKLAIFALSEPGKDDANQIFSQLQESRALAMKIICARGAKKDMHLPDATPYMMLRCEAEDLEFATKLAKKGVITAAGTAFGEMTKGMIRINYGALANILAPALELICDELYPH